MKFGKLMWRGAAVLALTAAGPAYAGGLSILYTGSGTLDWIQLDGRSVNISKGGGYLGNVSAGSHSILFSVNGAQRSANFTLDSSQQTYEGDWCLDVWWEEYRVLDADDCEYEIDPKY